MDPLSEAPPPMSKNGLIYILSFVFPVFSSAACKGGNCHVICLFGSYPFPHPFFETGHFFIFNHFQFLNTFNFQ